MNSWMRTKMKRGEFPSKFSNGEIFIPVHGFYSRFEEIEDEPVVAPKPDASKKATKEKNSGSKGKSQTPATNPNKPSGDKQFGNKPSENKFSGNKQTSSHPFGGN